MGTELGQGCGREVGPDLGAHLRGVGARKREMYPEDVLYLSSVRVWSGVHMGVPSGE